MACCTLSHRGALRDSVPRYFCGFLLAAFVGCSDTGPASPGRTLVDSGTPDTFGPLGLTCGTSAPCPAGLTCLDAGNTALGDFVAPGGFCTQGCTGDSDCAPLGDGVCVPLVPGDVTTLHCAPGCTRGDVSACGNRADVACWPRELVDGVSAGRVCLPTCNGNDQCPDGTVCDGQTNLCSRVASGGGMGLGSTCDPSGNNTCADGFCLELETAGVGVCSAYCRRGTFPQCSNDSEQGVCGWVPEGDEAAGPADIGLCALQCRCDADCGLAGMHCQAHLDLTGTTYPGLCTTATAVADTDCSQ